MHSIGLDAHKRYSQFEVLDHLGKTLSKGRLQHDRGTLQKFFAQFPPGTPVALETVGNWYWIADEIEAAGCLPRLAHAAKAKVMMGNVNKTDKIDAHGLAILQHNGTLPAVWIPPHQVRDERELPRTRMAFAKLRNAVKNRIHATLAKYALSIEDGKELFCKTGRCWLDQTILQLPPETQRCVQQELLLLDFIQGEISDLEDRIRQCIKVTSRIQLLKTLPGIGDILSIVIDREVGDISRFSHSDSFAAYCGTTPRVYGSGGKIHYVHLRKESNQYLQFAFIEAANVIVAHYNLVTWQNRHVVHLYKRIRARRCSAVAAGAVARHLSESAFWILKKMEPYREPFNPNPKRARAQHGALSTDH
jgi:transposase